MSNSAIEKVERIKVKQEASRVFFYYGRYACFPICFSTIFSIIVFSTLSFIFFSCSFLKGSIFGNCLSCPKHILAPWRYFPSKDSLLSESVLIILWISQHTGALMVALRCWHSCPYLLHFLLHSQFLCPYIIVHCSVWENSHKQSILFSVGLPH